MIIDKVNARTYVEEADAELVLADGDVERLLAGSLMQLLRDDAARSRMGVHGSRYARQRLTWDACAQRLLACYDQVLSGAKRGGGRRGR